MCLLGLESWEEEGRTGSVQGSDVLPHSPMSSPVARSDDNVSHRKCSGTTFRRVKLVSMGYNIIIIRKFYSKITKIIAGNKLQQNLFYLP